jgi:hypothetical protein
MRTAAAIAGLLLAAATAGAQWPSWSKQFDSYDRGNQALSSAVERLSVAVGPQAWTNYMTTNLWASYFSQGAKLKVGKNMLKAAVDAGSWVRPVADWSPTNSTGVTASNLLAWSGAPAGWWTNHPYVNLAAASNGWRFWPDVASNVAWMQSTAYTQSLSIFRTMEAEGYGTTETGSVAAAFDNLFVSPHRDIIETNTHAGADALLWMSSIGGSDTNWGATVIYEYNYAEYAWDPSTTPQRTSVVHAVESWVKTYKTLGGTFDRCGQTGLVKDVWYKASTAGPCSVGPLGLGVMPDAESRASLLSDIYEFFGWRDTLWFLIRYNVPTNGFKWFR